MHVPLSKIPIALVVFSRFLLFFALFNSNHFFIKVLSADEFGEGDLRFTISFVPISSNEATTNFFGHQMPHTDYGYRIGKTEISIAQFLQARAADARISRPLVNFWNSGRTDLNTDGNNPKFGVHAPVTYVNLVECFKFCNWLTSGNPYQGAYKIIQNDNGNAEDDVINASNYVDINSALDTYDTVYTIPTFIEWSKAAFFKPDGSEFSFYPDGSGSGNVYLGLISRENFLETYGDDKDIVFAGDELEAEITYVDTNGVEGSILLTKGLGGWNSNFQIYPWQVGSSAREQNGTYDLFGNVGEYFQDVLDSNNGTDFRVTASCWNFSNVNSNDYLGGTSYVESLNSLEAFSHENKSSRLHFQIEGARYGYKNVGFRVVARGVVPVASPMPEVQWTITDGAAHLHWESTVGRIYQLQYSLSLESPNWVNIGQKIYGSGGTEFFVVPVDTEEEKNRFYRVVDFD